MSNLDAYSAVTAYLSQMGQTDSAQPGGRAAFGQWPKEITVLHERDQKWIDLLLSTFAETETLNVLDAGCGNGLNALSFLLALRQHRLVNAHLRDIQDEAVEEVLKRYLDLSPGFQVDARQGDISQLDLPDRSLHGVLVTSVLGWLPSTEAVHASVAQFQRTLRPDGLVLAQVMSPFNRVGIYNNPDIQDGDTTRRDLMWEQVYANGQETDAPITVSNSRYQKEIILYTPSALSRVFTEHGFQVEEAEYFRNEQYPNRFSDQYPENVSLIARRI